MTQDAFNSSDALRSASPLRHARAVTFDQPLDLELGGSLPGVTCVYETYGQLNPARDNAVLICHALSGDSHVARHGEDPTDTPGWWELVVGPGKPIDTDRYFVICPNALGSCRGTTGPNSVNPQTGKRYGADFPTITIGDIVQVQRRLLDHLGIERLRAVVGGSLGGHQALTWATGLPRRVAGCLAIATSPRLTSQALAFDVVGRNAILHDPHFHGGQYYDHPQGPTVGLALARMLGHITYLSREAMTAKFDPSRLRPREVATDFEKKFSVGSYLAYQGHRFVERFDANSYVTLSLAMDLFDLGDSPAALEEALGRSACRWLVLSFSSDWLFPSFQSRQIVEALLATGKPVTYCEVQSPSGHDAFLLEDSLPTYGRMIRAFLEHLDPDAAPAPAEPAAIAIATDAAAPPGDSNAHDPTSIFHGRRLDYDQILRLAPPAASVLDLGCGNGELLSLLRRRGHPRVMGVELEEREIVACVERGLDVVQLDLRRGLAGFSDGQFDLVILSQTLQSIPDTERVLAEIVRVGKLGVVSFPNFAYWKLRKMLFEQGRSPKASAVYPYEWYNTPNRRFPSIADFQALCKDKGLRIHREVYLDSETQTQVRDDPNWNADTAILVISR